MDSLGARDGFVSGVGWVGTSKVITQIGTWMATIIIARLLVPEDYGLVGMSGLLVGIITLVGDFGLNASIIQKKEISGRELSTLFWQFVLFGILLSVLIYLLAPIGCLFWNESGLLNLIRLSALTYFIGSLSQIPGALMQKKMRFKEFGIVLSLSALSGSAVSVVLAFYGMGPYSLILGTLAVVTVKLLLLYLYEPFLPRLIFCYKETYSHLKFGAAITIERYLWWYYSNFDFWLASKCLGKTAYGSYSLAFQMASLPIEKISSIVNPVAFPAFSRIESPHEREVFFFSILKYMAYLSFPVFIGFFWTADDLIHVVLGEKWLASTFVFKMFVLIFPLRCLASLNSPLLNSIRRADVGVRNMAIGAVFGTIAFSIGVNFGITGLAYSWALFYPVFYLICLINVTRAAKISLRGYFRNIHAIVLNMMCMSLAIYLFQIGFVHFMAPDLTTMEWKIARLCGTIVVGAGTFLMFVVWADKPTVQDVIGFIRKKKVMV